LIVDILMDVAVLALLPKILIGIFDDGLAFASRIAKRWISAGPLGATACRRDGRALLASSHRDLRNVRAGNAKLVGRF
jgi:hypothetical protein